MCPAQFGNALLPWNTLTRYYTVYWQTAPPAGPSPAAPGMPPGLYHLG